MRPKKIKKPKKHISNVLDRSMFDITIPGKCNDCQFYMGDGANPINGCSLYNEIYTEFVDKPDFCKAKYVTILEENQKYLVH